MRRPLIAAAVLLLLGALAGCARPAGTDGDLPDDWRMLPAAAVPEPVAGICFDSAGYKSSDVTALEMPGTPVPCDGPHQAETFAVGPVPADLAKIAKRPDRDGFTAVYHLCEDAAAQYLGTDWQGARGYLYAQPPTYAEWLGGLRTYHCDFAATGPDGYTFTRYDKTFRDAAKPGGPLAQGCFASGGATADVLFTMLNPVACTAPHDVEYTGFVTSPAETAYPSTADATKTLGTACNAKLLAYLGMSHAAWARQRDVGGVWWRSSPEAGWRAGDHSARCYIMVDKRTISRSLKGNGDAAI